jgi:hypothetical protein
VSSQADPIRQPANDLSAFDISRQSPEQIALLFARWKEQRKRLNHRHEAGRGARPPHLKPVPSVMRGAPQDERPASGIPSEQPRHHRERADKSGSVHYSETFAALLATRGEPTIAQLAWIPDPLPRIARPLPPRRRSTAKWALAGAASVIALTAVAGGAVWHQPSWRPAWMQTAFDSEPKPVDVAVVAPPAEAAPSHAPSHALSPEPDYSTDIAMVEPFAATATAAALAVPAWPLQEIVDLALMKAAAPEAVDTLPLMPQLKPPAPEIHTASESVAVPEVVPSPMPAPKAVIAAPLPMPLSYGAASVVVPATDVPSAGVPPMATVAIDLEDSPEEEQRPTGMLKGGNDNSNLNFSDSGMSASGGETSGSTSSGGSAGSGTGGAGNPGGGTGGSGDGDTGGGDTGGDGSGGGDTGGGDTGGGDTGGGDTGGGDSGGGDSGGGDSGGSDSGGGGGDSGGGGGGDSGGGGGDSGGDGGGDSGGGGGGDSGGGDSGSGDTGGGGGDSGGGDSGGGDTGGGDDGTGGGLGGT